LPLQYAEFSFESVISPSLHRLTLIRPLARVCARAPFVFDGAARHVAALAAAAPAFF